MAKQLKNNVQTLFFNCFAIVVLDMIAEIDEFLVYDEML